MDKNSKKLKKLQLLKQVAKAQREAKMLGQEQTINLIQTKLMEQELEKMKEHLSSLEERRSELLSLKLSLDPDAQDDNSETNFTSDETENES